MPRIIIGPVRITASAPTRIDLAGGTIDIWPIYLFHPGAQTLNIAISLRAHARIEPRDDDSVALVSEDTNRQVVLASGPALRDDLTLPLLGRLAHHFGARGLTITTRGESPAGAGIAGSSALNIAVCGASTPGPDRHWHPRRCSTWPRTSKRR